jgi:hypothetical protein
MTAFDRAWELIKAPFEIHHPNRGKIGDIWRRPLYSGGDRIHDDFKYWTDNKDEALAYALYGSAVHNENNEWADGTDLPMRETYPAIKVMENPPNEIIPLMQDPAAAGYIDEFDEMGGEFMDEDELYEWIASMLPDYEMTPEEEKRAARGWTYNDEGDSVAPRASLPISSLGTTGFFHTDVARDEHMAGALNRLRDQMSGRIALPDDVLYRVDTAHTDNLKHMDFEDLLEQWDVLDDGEKDFIKRTNPTLYDQIVMTHDRR